MTRGSNLTEKLKFGGGIFSTVGWVCGHLQRRTACRVCVFCLLKGNVWGASWSNWWFFEVCADGVDALSVRKVDWWRDGRCVDVLHARQRISRCQRKKRGFCRHYGHSSFNFIKRSALHTPLCDALGECHIALLYHLKWGAWLVDDVWPTKMAYFMVLTFFFQSWTKWIILCRAAIHTPSSCMTRWKARKEAMRWRQWIREGNIFMLPPLKELADSALLSLDAKQAVIGHLEVLERQFEK